jgi:tetratricopeptide (TPR) repeat protein
VLPSSLRSLDAFAQLALRSSASAAAATAALRAVTIAPDGQRFLVLAETELALQRIPQALAHLAEAQRRDASGDELAISAAQLLARYRLFGQATSTLRALLDRHPAAGATPTLWRQLGSLYELQGDWKMAGRMWILAIDREASPFGRHAMVADVIALYRRHHAMAVAAAELASARSARTLVLRGDIELELNKRAQAKASYEAARKLDPADADPLLRLAQLPGTSAQTKIDHYQQLIRAHPVELRYAYELADVHYQAGDKVETRAVLEEIAQRFASVATVQDHVAGLLTRYGFNEEALPCRKRAAELDVGNAEYALAVADLQQTLRHTAEATAEYREFLRRTGGDHAAYDRVLTRADGLPGEGTFFEEALSRWPEDQPLRRRYAGWLERQRDYRKAAEEWKTLEKRARTPFDAEQARFHLRRVSDKLLIDGAK